MSYQSGRRDPEIVFFIPIFIFGPIYIGTAAPTNGAA